MLGPELSSAPERVGAQLFGAGFHWFIRARKNTQSLSQTHKTGKQNSVVLTVLDLNEKKSISVAMHIYPFWGLGHNTSINCDFISNLKYLTIV